MPSRFLPEFEGEVDDRVQGGDAERDDKEGQDDDEQFGEGVAATHGSLSSG